MIRPKRSREAEQAEQAAIRWLVRLNSPDLGESEKDSFFAWLNASPLHQAAYIKAEDLWRRGEVLRYVENIKPERHSNVIWSLGLAVTCIALVAMLFFLRAPEPEYLNAQTLVGEQRELLLSDGSRLVLNTDSEVLVELHAKRRLVYLLRGEAFFEVFSDPKRPFDVHTNDGTVRVLGTQFSVRATGTDSIVTVLEGKVGLSQNPLDEDARFEPAITLTANQQLTLRNALPGAAALPIDAQAALAWRQRQLIYRGESLQKVVEDLNRYLSLRIVVADHALSDLQVSAVLQLQDANATAQALAAALGLKVEPDPQDDATLILRAAE